MLVTYHSNYDNFVHNITQFYNFDKSANDDYKTVFYVIILIFFLQDPILIFLLLDLMVLHIFLKMKHMTTYELILLQRKEKEKNEKSTKPKSKQTKKRPIINVDENASSQKALEIENENMLSTKEKRRDSLFVIFSSFIFFSFSFRKRKKVLIFQI